MPSTASVDTSVIKNYRADVSLISRIYVVSFWVWHVVYDEKAG